MGLTVESQGLGSPIQNAKWLPDFEPFLCRSKNSGTILMKGMWVLS